MTARAVPFAEKYFFATLRISGQGSRLTFPLERAHIADQGSNLPFTEIVKGRHSGSRHPVQDNPG